MKTIISVIILFAIMVMPVNAKNLVGSKWVCRVSSSCIDTIKFNRNYKFEDYSCELNYTCKGHYGFKKGIVILIEKDDSQGEDNKKVTFYRFKYKLIGDCLYPISNEELVNGKWKKIPESLVENTVFHRIHDR